MVSLGQTALVSIQMGLGVERTRLGIARIGLSVGKRPLEIAPVPLVPARTTPGAGRTAFQIERPMLRPRNY
jgi:hypothetical protein